ncbi:OXA1L mitochondrial inner membrane protein [Megachile rotundata]|uniref:OXA1L mitochondrial inner membrane protein n=1 Tax=Megachile rotundata TaxID=143995 RepID=UPI000258DEC4|nr:PREDICTED: mitochondrial inner membrane protein OXA1L isoform X2 [Megachile rotundata]
MLRLSVNLSRELLRSSKNVQKLTRCKFSRLAYNTTNVSLRTNVLFNVHKHSRVPTIYIIRFQSTVDSKAETIATNTQENVTSPAPAPQDTIGSAKTTETSQSFISEIPDAPIPPPSEEVTSAVADILTATGEPTFTSLGLGGYGPVGIAEYALEMLHVSCGLPWWAAISLLTIIVKLLTIPPTISMTRNNVRMCNIMPRVAELQEKMSMARREGNAEEASITAYELQHLLKENKVSAFPFFNAFFRIILHIPIFIALREMALLPVESLKTGGLWWFTDLTVPDPYYVLPIFTSIGLYIVTEHTLRSGAVANPSPTIRYLMRGVPIITFLFGIHFPGSVLCYWVLSNFITIAQNEILRNNKVKLFFNIPLPVQHKTIVTDGVLKKKKFKESFTESWTNMKISKKMANRLRADELQFNQAGKGPIVRTFKYNPVTQQSAKSASAIKK